MSVSTLKEKEIPELVALVNRAYRGDESKKGWTSEADLLVGGIRVSLADITGMVGNPRQTILVYRDAKDQIIGCVSLLDQQEFLYLGMLTVSPALQGAGIGKKLLEAAAEYALKLGRGRIRMTVITARKELLQWYHRHGYADTGKRKPFPYQEGYGEPSQALEFAILEKEVSG